MLSHISRPPVLGSLRLACVDDASLIINLVNESMSKNFRVQNAQDIVYLIENCVLSICQLDVNDDIVGFLAAKDYPLIPSVHPFAWEEYIWTKYKTIELKARNTLFLHLMCWNTIYGRELVDSMLRSVFMHDLYVQHIAMVKSMIDYQLLVPGQLRYESSFRRVQVLERGVPGDQLPILFIADRHEVSPRLRIRRAVEEDNDDIVPIIERYSSRLRQMYGEFYISELISKHPESERVLLVCEHKELAVGVMCLNTQINYEALEESFEMSSFAGLRKLHSLPAKKSTDLDSTLSTHGNISTITGTVVSQQASEYMIHPNDTKSKVTWIFDENEPKDLNSESTCMTPSSPYIASQVPHTTQLHILNLLEDDDEELEFDIVNIDKLLLRVPKLISYDVLGHGPVENIKKMLDTCKHEHMESFDGKVKKDKTKKPTPVTATCNPPEPIRYSGPPNAFLLELFAMHPDYDERYGFDMLEAAFELFPNRDYCVMCLPSNHVSFPLLEHFTLVTPFCWRLRFINETLYVAHVNSVRGDISVRPGEAYDILSLNHVLEHAPRAQALLDLFESTLSSQILQSFILLSQNQPIGVVVIGPGEDGTVIRAQYVLEPEPRRSGTDGTVLAGVMSPIMEPHSRWYLRELLRQSRYTTLFWICRLFARGDAHPGRNLMSLAGHMAPVHPRASVPNISGNKSLDVFFKVISTPFALWVLERPLSSMPKVYVNNSIVVVGASCTGLAFLETLLLGPTAQYLTFSNVTLVSEHGLPTVPECLRAADICVPRYGRYTDRYLKCVPFYFYLDVMSAVMIGIDRKKKCIHLNGGGMKFYDELVLTCGQQFQHPDYLHESLELVKEVEKGKPCDRVLMDDPTYQPDKVPLPPDMPDNVMVINSLFEANIYLRKLLCMISEAKDCRTCLSDENQVIVYGECIEAYSCIAALLELGLSAETIAFVEPFPPEDTTALRVNCFNDETVDERVQANLDKLGIRVLRQCYLAGWLLSDNRVEALHLMSPLQAIRLPCFAVFYFGLKAIDLRAFKAINESGLVYDGGLVVSPQFETNDPHIFGAGTCARYSRRLYATRRMHKYYSSEDIGQALARQFLSKMDPFVIGRCDLDSSNSDLLPKFSSCLLVFKGSHSSLSSTVRLSLGINKRSKWQPVLKFESPIVQFAILPGPLYYLKLRKPGPEIPMEVQNSLPHQGHTLITDRRNNYFRLQLNALHCVEAVTCLSKKMFSSDIMSHLYGKHEAFFNKLLTRYQNNEIEDLYEYFTQPWMSAVYQETFSDLLQKINDHDVSSTYNKAKRATVEDTTLTKESQIQFSCSDLPNCGFGPMEAKNFGTLRSLINKFVARTSSLEIVKTSKASDIPTECGQSAALRGEAAAFWKTIGGERIVMSHLDKYLNKNNVTNPHYSMLNPKFT